MLMLMPHSLQPSSASKRMKLSHPPALSPTKAAARAQRKQKLNERYAVPVCMRLTQQLSRCAACERCLRSSATCSNSFTTATSETSLSLA